MQDNNAGSFKVILKGSLNVDVSLEEAKHNLSQLFGITPDQANSFLEGRPTIIKNNLDAGRADRYRQVLTQAGVDFEIIEEAPALSLVEGSENETATDASTALPVCPKCGYRAQGRDDPLLTKYNGLGKCPHCGIIPGNYRKVREERKQSTADRRQLRPTEKASNS